MPFSSILTKTHVGTHYGQRIRQAKNDKKKGKSLKEKRAAKKDKKK
jgi:hypothetical protein